VSSSKIYMKIGVGKNWNLITLVIPVLKAIASSSVTSLEIRRESRDYETSVYKRVWLQALPTLEATLEDNSSFV